MIPIGANASLNVARRANITDLIAKASYSTPATVDELRNRVATNVRRYQLNYVLIWFLITWLVNRSHWAGALLWFAALFVSFVVEHAWLSTQKRFSFSAVGLLFIVISSGCATPSCLSWSQLIAGIVIVVHAGLFAPKSAPVEIKEPAPQPIVSKVITPKKTQSPLPSPAPSPSTQAPKYPPPAVPVSTPTPSPAPSPAKAEQPATPQPSEADSKRTKIAQEIEETETRYLVSLTVFKDVFMNPMLERAQNKDPAFNLDDMRAIFSDIEVIINYSQTLRDDLRSRTKNWDNSTSKVGDIFLHFAAFLKTYQAYIVNYTNRLKTLQKCMKNSSFASALQKLESDPRCKDAPINSFLIMPVQRIPRYLLLLNELLKKTPADHPDRSDLEKAIQKIQEVATALNEAERAAQSAFKLYELQLALTGTEEGFQLLEPHRKFVREGLVLADLEGDGTQQDKELKNFYGVLCNDCFLICKAPSSVSRHSMKLAPSALDSPEKSGRKDGSPTKLPVKRTLMLTNATLQSTQGNQFVIKTGSSQTLFEAVTLSDKKEWLAGIQQAIEEAATKAQTMQKSD